MPLRPLHLPAALTPEECARLRAMAAAAGLRPGGLVGGVAGGDIRRAELVWVDDLPDAAWAGERLAAIVARANRDSFGFDLTDFAESAQIARYRAEGQGHFHWHGDVGQGPAAARRKLTVVVQLSPPGDYAGGVLETWGNAEPQAHPRSEGDAMVFPSFLLHRVTPVTDGVRWSLTQWVHGPAFQ
ncbi:MAG: 2OG-Fe(II) oxygenase [Paracoccaceae bacterium]